MSLAKLKTKFLHLWHGCAKFNRLHPHWVKGERDQRQTPDYPVYPKCTVCGHSGWWIWGYKRFEPDLAAQKVQGGKPDESSAYWAKNDGYT